jgi:hypothetical protein
VATDSFGSPGREDSDAWLADSGAELEAELQRAARAGAGGSGGSAQAAGEADGSGAAGTQGSEAQLDQMSKRLQVSTSRNAITPCRPRVLQQHADKLPSRCRSDHLGGAIETMHEPWGKRVLRKLNAVR